jgi:hypothetical protein
MNSFSGKYVVLLFALQVVNLPFALATEYINCSQEQVTQIQQAEGVGINESEILLNKLKTSALDVNRVNREVSNDQKLIHATSVLSCALDEVGNLNYECKGESQTAVAKTDWIFAKKIKIFKNFFDFSTIEQAGILIHEYTHKCGTTDAAYFWTEAPHSTALIKWPMIADTYHYWISDKFCVPGETCSN